MANQAQPTQPSLRRVAPHCATNHLPVDLLIENGGPKVDLGIHFGSPNDPKSEQKLDAEKVEKVIPTWIQHDENMNPKRMQNQFISGKAILSKTCFKQVFQWSLKIEGSKNRSTNHQTLM